MHNGPSKHCIRELMAWAACCAVISLIAMGCAKDRIAADTEPPSSVQLVIRSDDTATVELGIDAVPEGNYVYLSWYPSTDPDLAGYRLYRQAEDSVDKVIVVEGLEATEYTDRDAVLAPNSQTGFSMGFYYWVTAFDESGNESPLSASAYYRLMDKPALSTPVVQGDSLIMSWSYNHLDPTVTSGFVVRLHRRNGAFWTPIYNHYYQEFFPLTLVYNGLLTPGEYRYQVDVVGASPQDLPTGSEEMIEFSL
jgi:hypothetical protein